MLPWQLLQRRATLLQHGELGLELQRVQPFLLLGIQLLRFLHGSGWLRLGQRHDLLPWYPQWCLFSVLKYAQLGLDYKRLSLIRSWLLMLGLHLLLFLGDVGRNGVS